MNLLIKELRSVMRGILYIVFVGAVLLFYITQFSGTVGDDIAGAEQNKPAAHGNALQQPLPGQQSYGTEKAEIPQQVMPGAVANLLAEWAGNQYATYPLGFIKNVRLADAQQQKISDTIEKITGMDAAALKARHDAWVEENLEPGEGGAYQLNPTVDVANAIPIIVDYDTFKAEMDTIDELLGGGSYYAPADLAQYGRAEITYQQALGYYEDLLYKDKISGAYARLMSDYMGIAVAIFAVFLPVGFLMRDRRAAMEQLVYSRRCSSARLMITRYVACLAAVLLPVLLLGIAPMVQLAQYAARHSLAVDYFAFLKYTLGWVGPTAMMACSVGFFFTTLTGTPVGIAVQFIWSFLDVMVGASGLTTGAYGTVLVPRHNSVGAYHIVQQGWGQLVANRVGYALAALVLLCFSILFYEFQRRGRLDVPTAISKIFRSHKNPVQADAVA